MGSIIKTSIIGVGIRVSSARNPSLVGLSGTIVDETKHTLLVETSRGVKRLLKDAVVLELPKERIRIKGSLLVGRPEERIKRKSR